MTSNQIYMQSNIHDTSYIHTINLFSSYIPNLCSSTGTNSVRVAVTNRLLYHCIHNLLLHTKLVVL
jgi:hypothetical protein